MSSPAEIFSRFVEGAELAEVTFGPITRTDIVRYAGASGDFNPIHHDEIYARSLGNPGVFAMGMLPAGILASVVTGWLGVGHVRRFSVRFQSRVWPGDTLTFSGRVERKEAQDGEGSVTCALCVSNQAGEEVIAGRAEARFQLA